MIPDRTPSGWRSGPWRPCGRAMLRPWLARRAVGRRGRSCTLPPARCRAATAWRTRESLQATRGRAPGRLSHSPSPPSAIMLMEWPAPHHVSLGWHRILRGGTYEVPKAAHHALLVTLGLVHQQSAAGVAEGLLEEGLRVVLHDAMGGAAQQRARKFQQGRLARAGRRPHEAMRLPLRRVAEHVAEQPADEQVARLGIAPVPFLEMPSRSAPCPRILIREIQHAHLLDL